MKIRIHNATNNKPKFVYYNSDSRKMYENLSYTDSLIGIGSCSFTLIPSEEAATGEFDTDIAGLEYVYLENENGDIVWGGVLVSFSGGKERIRVSCLGMKYALQLVKLSGDFSVSGNALVSIGQLLIDAKSKREMPIEMSEKSEVVDETTLNFTTGKSIYSAIKDIVENAYLRFIFEFEKDGVDITPKMLVRSIIGVSPEGVGINRGLDSKETEDKVQLKYNINSPKKSNLIDFSVDYDMRGMVTKAKVVGKVDGQLVVFDSTPTPLSSVLEYYFGAIEKTVVNHEIGDQITGEAYANSLLNNVSFRISASFNDLYPFEINVGDRISISLSTKLFKIAGIEDGIEIPITPRVEEKRVVEKDGYRVIELKLNSNNSKRTDQDIISQISNLNNQEQNLNSRFIAS